MIDDPLRTKPLIRAIKKVVRKGDIVLDIGTGLGILAIAAARAGAGRVFAIDCDGKALSVARRRVEAEGISDSIEFSYGLSFDYDIPQRADIIICETVGSFAFDENILATIKDAKKRLLRRGGRVIPKRLDLWGAPLCRMPVIKKPADIAIVGRRAIIGPPVKIRSVDFQRGVPDSIHDMIKFRCGKSATIKAIALWPRVVWCKDEITDASPLLTRTHWRQGILPIEHRRVRTGEIVRMEFIIEPHPDDPLTMTERLWRWVD